MSTTLPVVYDTGALLAAERNDKHFLDRHERLCRQGRSLLVITPVLAQAWRNGARQERLARFLKTCSILAPTERLAYRAGELIGRSGLSDAVDAMVVAAAFDRAAIRIVTSDPGDIAKLCEASGRSMVPAIHTP
ncbi:PIN domain-containing protein [Thermobifida halotolerans]|uniref:PIN domain-containing protein n=1 Tax=Thermobifida halotolerans TaxID=483545 RepID=A0A399G0S9_9ACTN|nr:PIN domain-containing protein [Thermobifida halotolerans]UOE17897.1 PIN domain-containing protein [Thermobifida halotolerans]